jgi:hypothetical protein
MRCFLLKTLSCCLLSCLTALGDSALEGNRPWLRWHFAGTKAIKTNKEAPTVNEIWRLPESKRLANVLVDRLSQAPEREIFGANASAPTVRRRIIKEFVEGLFSYESIGEFNGNPSEHPNLTIGIKLPLTQLDDWDRNIRRYLGTLGWEAPEENPDNDNLDWTAAHENPALLARLIKQADWLLFSIGPDGFSQLPEWNANITDNHPPTLTDKAALEIDGDLESLAQWLGSISVPSLPSFSAIFKPEETSVRTEATFHLKKEIQTPLPDWQPPTEHIFEPIVSFSGARGLSPFVESLPVSEKLAREGIPEQFFSWSRPAIISTNSIPLFPMYVGWPIPNDQISIADLTKRLPLIAGPGIMKSGSARLVSFPDRNESIIQILPSFIQPFVRGVTNKTHGVRIAGLFPLSRTPSPAPSALFDQLNSKENIVYYQWEITQRRIETYKTLIRFLSFMFQKPQGEPRGAGFQWLTAIESKMGNAVTIVTAPEPKRLELVRKSHSGFTGLELTAIARWIEASSFPWIDTELLSTWNIRSFLPPTTAPTAPGQPKKNVKTRR